MLSHRRLFASCLAPRPLAGLGALALALHAAAGGAGENVLLIIDPTDVQSIYLGNYYKAARSIPDSNVLYASPAAASYAAFVSNNLVQVAGAVNGRNLADHIDFIVIAPTTKFYIPAPSLIADGCSPVTRFSLTAAYSSAFVTSEISAGTLTSTWSNRYYSTSNTNSTAFDSSSAYSGGNVSTSANARRYYIGAQLAYAKDPYNDNYGNTLPEIVAMIDRSVAADGTRPTGTFCFMDNPNDAVRNVRSTQFSAAVGTINTLAIPGVSALTISGVLPARTDCLGIMSGFDTADVLGSPFAILPGAFADNLTSWAATFDIPYQTKCTDWIRKGAIGTEGMVEEPCNYTGKFPNARLHSYFALGMTLGEAYFRSLQYFPFQSLFLGDPLARPFAYIPTVTPPAIPSNASGVVTFTPAATTLAPAGIGSFELHVDGVKVAAANKGQNISFDTTTLRDGWHEARLLAFENSGNKTVGHWVGSFNTSTMGHAATLAVSPTTGSLSTKFTFSIGATGSVREARLVSNGRIVAAAPSVGDLALYGRNLGAGPVSVQAEILFGDGTLARSAPLSFTFPFDTAYTNPTPVSFSYVKLADPARPQTIELPVSADSDPASFTFTILTNPTKFTLSGSGPTRLLTPIGTPKGVDAFTYKVTSPWGTSATATVTVQFPCPADYNADGFLDIYDFSDFVTCFEGGACPPGKTADFNNDGFPDIYDFSDFVTAFEAGC